MSSRPHPLLTPFLPHKTTLYTATNVPLPCTIDPLSSRSFVTLATLKQHFAPLHLTLKDVYPPLPSLLSPAAAAAAKVKVKTPKFVRLGFAFKDALGERVEVACDVMKSERCHAMLYTQVLAKLHLIIACRSTSTGYESSTTAADMVLHYIDSRMQRYRWLSVSNGYEEIEFNATRLAVWAKEDMIAPSATFSKKKQSDIRWKDTISV
ncbi:hypothetical protein BGZ57DRAFT_856901 [Hyaloscypha finlandica]|nr:hypothetical protein BGZ57DRAFT_856901 [Hyaloscypha finlandica]